MVSNQEIFRRGDKQHIWQRYCGFLDLTLPEFMEIQRYLLMEQIKAAAENPMLQKFMPTRPETIDEFRATVPMTRYQDYAAYLTGKNAAAPPVQPYRWACTSGRGGKPKWVPYTEEAMEHFAVYSVAVVILACANARAEVNIDYGLKVLHNLPSPPYMPGVVNEFLAPELGARLIPPLEKYDNDQFEEKIRDGFQMALASGVDFLSSLTSVLVKMGERFTQSSGGIKLNRHMLHPQIFYRFASAWWRARREGRGLLPKDLWPLKGLACYGMDTSIYKDKLRYYWGREPLETYGSTETMVLATQSWTKKGLTFFPASCFLEFAPEEEWLKSREDKGYQPRTVLLDELEPGKKYEVIATSFYGMPFLRYRIGDIIKCVALEDEEAGVKLPQIVFDCRGDDLIDIAGFARLDEKTLHQALAKSGLAWEDWSARKEDENGSPVMRLYVELKKDSKATEVEEILHKQLVSLNSDYAHLESMLGLKPLRVTLLPAGSFKRYYEEKRRAGADLGHLKPPHMNASDEVMENLKTAAPDKTG